MIAYREFQAADIDPAHRSKPRSKKETKKKPKMTKIFEGAKTDTERGKPKPKPKKKKN